MSYVGDWHIGSVFLNNNDSLKGLVAYSFPADIIQVKSAQKEYTLTSMQITRFELNDDSIKRVFRVYNYHNKDGFEVPVLFEELVLNDKFKVLVREEVAYENRGSFMGQGFAPEKEMYYSFFFMEGNDIFRFEDSKKEVLEIMSPRQKEVEQYAKSNKLKFFFPPDLQQIFKFYYNLISHVEDSSDE